MRKTLLFLFLVSSTSSLWAQHHDHHAQNVQLLENIEPQPLIANAIRVGEALSFIGSSLPTEYLENLNSIQEMPFTKESVRRVQEILDPFCLASIEINPESRVKVFQGAAEPILMEEGWSTFLVKVHNQAHVTSVIEAESPNSLPVLHRSTGNHRMDEKNFLSAGQLDNRFLEIQMFNDRPLKPNLSGFDLEYAIIQIFSKVSGKKEVKIGFNVGQGTQDIGFRNTIDILFDIQPAVKVTFNVNDWDGASTIASFIVTDGIDRFSKSEPQSYYPEDYRNKMAMTRHWEEPANKALTHKISSKNKLNGIYPLPSRRVASRDEFPDFFFQPQVYRMDGEYIYLPPGKFQVVYGKGPEYHIQHKEIIVPEKIDAMEVDFSLKRWINMASLGWFSGDHHIHAAGCSHYESPEEGVLPEHMWRQIQGEDLKLGSNLTWGPSWYHQKKYFTGKDHPFSDLNNILRYDIEVSGFPSSHAGHLVLLNLKEDDYPNTSVIEDWPSWTLPILTWAKEQGGVTGYAHSGLGLYPVQPTDELPNYVLPKMDGIGANEFIVTVTHDVVDFYSMGNTPAPAELNMWYHTLNSGFRTRISGETDFPCISDERVGSGRIYAKLDGELSFSNYMEALKIGRSYVSDGFSHLIDFQINDVVLGDNNSELKVKKNTVLDISVNAAAFLSEIQDEIGSIIASRGEYQSPYWHIERARIGNSRKIPIELIVNGVSVEKQEIIADGNWNNLKFDFPIERSSWIAIRVYASAHTNPIFVLVDGNPIREKASAEWCRKAIDKCWEMKSVGFKKEEKEAAKMGYDYARKVFDDIIMQAD
ncbi:CehA/McbA family metallohydrolase [Negadavirga shengliensis]|uniref:CehA/McbA family metallohydrolase n=1 Tax=Negadavirga shengliensis TaxID=1389218 RepID=A0ABV9SX91_9BACT